MTEQADLFSGDTGQNFWDTYQSAVFDSRNMLDGRDGNFLLTEAAKFYPNLDISTILQNAYSRGVVVFACGSEDEVIAVPYVMEPRETGGADPHGFVAQSLRNNNERYLKDYFWPLHNWLRQDGTFITYANSVYGKIGPNDLRNRVALSLAKSMTKLSTIIVTHNQYEGCFTTRDQTGGVSVASHQLSQRR